MEEVFNKRKNRMNKMGTSKKYVFFFGKKFLKLFVIVPLPRAINKVYIRSCFDDALNSSMLIVLILNRFNLAESRHVISVLLVVFFLLLHNSRPSKYKI